MKRKHLSKSEIKDLNQHIAQFNFVFDKKDTIERISDNVITYYMQNGKLAFIEKDGLCIPSLHLYIAQKIAIPKCVVDMGAIKFVIGGADIMRPGIVSIETDLPLGSLVVIVEVEHQRPLAIGKLLLDSNEITQMQKGKVVANLHYLGDSFWNFSL
jgi:PUA-domain protein